jgi:hypothetical protein
MKGEILMLVSETADGSRAAIGALWSFNWGEGVSFHTFCVPENPCVCLLLKNLEKCMPKAGEESVQSVVGKTQRKETTQKTEV